MIMTLNSYYIYFTFAAALCYRNLQHFTFTTIDLLNDYLTEL